MRSHILAGTWRLLLFGLLLAPFLLASGCGFSGTVTGKVLYQGTPLKGGTVTFTSTQAQGSQVAEIGEDGIYHVTMPTGPVKIAVETASAKAGQRPRGMTPPPGVTLPAGAANNPVYGGGTTPAANRYTRIPEDYANPDKSQLTYTVTTGTQTHDIELK
jgi:hypothetical protein